MSETRAVLRCAIYTRKSTEEGLEQSFNTLQAQREAAEAYIRSQRQGGWLALETTYDDVGYSGATLDRPALQRLLSDVRSRRVDCVLVYKVDRLSRSLLDFSRLMAMFEQYGVAFVSVTQEFNTSSSLGRLTLNLLLTFAQFERELISERTRDKLGAARRKGKWIGGIPILGYDVAAEGGRLLVNEAEAVKVREIFLIAGAAGSLQAAVTEISKRGIKTKEWRSRGGRQHTGQELSKSTLRALLANVLYIGSVRHKGTIYPGEQAAIVETEVWERVNQQFEIRGRHQCGRIHRLRGCWLKGYLYCGQCGTAMVVTGTTRHGRRYSYYACPESRENRCEQAPVYTDDLEAGVRRALAGELESADGKDVGRKLHRVTYNSGTRKVTMETTAGGHQELVLEEVTRVGVRGRGSNQKGRVPRISRLVALAIKLERMIADGKIGSRVELARSGQVTRARLSQILGLRNLAPAIQEKLLWLPNTTRGPDPITEKSLRQIALLVDWEEQERQFQALFGAR